MEKTKITRDRKLKIRDTIYVFRVPMQISLIASDIIKAGHIMMIRRGIMPSEDVNGELIGTKVAIWNSLKAMDVEPSFELDELILLAAERTQAWLFAKQTPEQVRPRLSVSVFEGAKIEWDDIKEKYYINTKCYCANCHLPIPSTQILHISHTTGKVCDRDPIIPIDPEVGRCPHSKKYLHKECKAKQISCDHETLEKVKELVGKEERIKESGPIKMREKVMNLISDHSIDANFRCGVAWLYFQNGDI